MIISFRYHIFTITAIFAALGLGILIGSSIIGNEGLIDEQRHIINNIKNDINNLKKENTDLTKGISTLEAELSYREIIEKNLFSILLKDYLKEDKLLLIHNELENTKINKVKEYLKIMGTETIIINTKQLDGDIFSRALNDPNSSNKLISWNIDINTLGKYIQGSDLKNKAIIEYNKGDVLGLVYKIVNYNEKNKNTTQSIVEKIAGSSQEGRRDKRRSQDSFTDRRNVKDDI